MATRIQVRRDTAGNWTSANPTLASGEIGLVTDSNKVVGCKIGTGSTAWTALEYAFPVLQTGANVNTAGDNTDATFLLKGLSGQSAAVFGIEETGATDLVLEINKSGDITIRNDADNSTQLTIVAETGNTDIVNGTLDVGGAVDFDSTLNVDGAVTMQDDVTINADNKMFRIQNNSAADKFTVDTDTGATVIAGDVTANGNITGDDACTLYAPADNAKASGGGSIVQVQYTQVTSTAVYSSSGANTDTAVSALAVTITPKSTNSVIMIDVSFNGEINHPNDSGIWINRTGGSGAAELRAPSAGSRPRVLAPFSISYQSSTQYANFSSTPNPSICKYFDLPNTTSAVTYTLYAFDAAGSGVYLNRTYNDTDTVDYQRMVSFISATELAAKA